MCKNPLTELTAELLLDTMGEGVVVLDKDGKVIRVNPAATQIIGFKKEDFEGMNVYQMPRGLQLFDANRSPMNGDQLAGARALKEQQPVLDLLIGVNRAGQELRWIVSNGYPVFKKGKLVGAMAVFSDVTREREIMRRLRENERRYGALTDALTISLSNTPAITDDEMKVELLSKREREVLALLAGGLDNQQIADKLGIRRTTIRSHLATIEDKLNVENEREAILVALRARLVNLYE